MSKWHLRRGAAIEAFQWTGGPDQAQHPEWAVQAIRDGVIRFEGVGTDALCAHLTTRVGPLTAYPGDFIIRDTHPGYVWFCNPKAFLATYEPVATPFGSMTLDTRKLRDIRERFIFQGESQFALQLADELDRLRELANAGANVIAVALGDGGHRLAEVGPRVAAEEAIAAISRLPTAVETEGDA